MSKARNLADLLDASGDVVSGALDNVPASNDASALTTGTLPVERVPYVGRRNLIINGGFQVWQRGISFTTANAYTADRWHWSNNYSVTVNRTAFASTDNNPSGKYYLRVGANNNSHSTAGVSFRQHIENVTSVAPNTSITLSYWIRSSEVTSWRSQVWERYNGWSSYYQLGSYTDTISSSWTKITHTFTTGARSGITIVDGANTLTIQLQSGSTFTGTNTIDIAQVQLEVGSVATPFEHRSYGEELALCERYYQVCPISSVFAASISSGQKIDIRHPIKTALRDPDNATVILDANYPDGTVYMGTNLGGTTSGIALDNSQISTRPDGAISFSSRYVLTNTSARMINSYNTTVDNEL